MGMFDELTIKYPLPIPDLPQDGWQTKDTPAQAIDFYEIREDGTLWYAMRDDETGMPGCWTPRPYRGQLTATNTFGDWRSRYDVSFWFDGRKVIGLFILHDGQYIHGTPETCKTCPAWERMSYIEGWGKCLPAESVGGEPEDTGTKAYAMDSEGFHADLRTHETFSCNQRPSEWPLNNEQGE